MPYHTPVSKIWQWSLAVERRLPANMTAEAAYVGSHGSGLQFQADINQVPANKLGGGQAARPYPQYLGIGPSVPGALTGLYNNISNYNAMQLSLQKQMGFGLLADVNFTWSKMLDDQDTSGWGSHYGDTPTIRTPINPSANYGPSNFNSPKMFKGYLVYMLPVGSGHQLMNHGIGDAVLGGWKVSSMFLANAGNSVHSDHVLCHQCRRSGWVSGIPNRVGNPKATNQSINNWFNQLAYATPANNTFGNDGRNSLYGPDLTDIDLSLGKTFNIPKWESAHFEIRMDATNFMNHPSFSLPNNQLSAAALASGVANPSVGQITATTQYRSHHAGLWQILLLGANLEGHFRRRTAVSAVLLFWWTAKRYLISLMRVVAGTGISADRGGVRSGRFHRQCLTNKVGRCFHRFCIKQSFVS